MTVGDALGDWLTKSKKVFNKAYHQLKPRNKSTKHLF